MAANIEYRQSKRKTKLNKFALAGRQSTKGGVEMERMTIRGSLEVSRGKLGNEKVEKKERRKAKQHT